MTKEPRRTLEGDTPIVIGIISVVIVIAPLFALELWWGGSEQVEHLSILLAFFGMAINQLVSIHNTTELRKEQRQIRTENADDGTVQGDNG